LPGRYALFWINGPTVEEMRHNGPLHLRSGGIVGYLWGREGWGAATTVVRPEDSQSGVCPAWLHIGTGRVRPPSQPGPDGMYSVGFRRRMARGERPTGGLGEEPFVPLGHVLVVLLLKVGRNVLAERARWVACAEGPVFHALGLGHGRDPGPPFRRDRRQGVWLNHVGQLHGEGLAVQHPARGVGAAGTVQVAHGDVKPVCVGLVGVVRT
jgi:hypothetical protein